MIIQRQILFNLPVLLSSFDSKPNRSIFIMYNGSAFNGRRRHKFKRIYFSPGAQVSALLYFVAATWARRQGGACE